MNKKVCLYISLSFLIISILACSTDSNEKIEANNLPKITSQDSTGDINKKNELYESFRKIGWIKEDRYRALVFIITSDECHNSSIADIESRIKLAAYNSLQKELNPSSNRNASIQINKLIDSYGKMKQVDKNCNSENIFFYDIIKNDLKSDFEKIKNTK